MEYNSEPLGIVGGVISHKILSEENTVLHPLEVSLKFKFLNLQYLDPATHVRGYFFFLKLLAS